MLQITKNVHFSNVSIQDFGPFKMDHLVNNFYPWISLVLPPLGAKIETIRGGNTLAQLNILVFRLCCSAQNLESQTLRGVTLRGATLMISKDDDAPVLT